MSKIKFICYGALPLLLLTLPLVPLRNKITRESERPKRIAVLSEQTRSPEFKQAISVWVNKKDVRPKLIHAWPGKAVVTIENVAQMDVTIHVERLSTGRVQPVDAVTFSASSARKSREITLAVGEYQLYEASQPDTKVRLVVEPRGATAIH
ncbi:MAG TPA: hypothetical protein DC054_10255 [Blastocatellia bacterium]|nr:hypothetical protein [Blastocatellia bacterium]